MLHGAEVGKHIRLRFLGIIEDISALLLEDSRDTIEEVALQTQGEGRTRIDDGLACLGDVDLLDDLFVELALHAFTNSGHQPVVKVSNTPY